MLVVTLYCCVTWNDYEMAVVSGAGWCWVVLGGAGWWWLGVVGLFWVWMKMQVVIGSVRKPALFVVMPEVSWRQCLLIVVAINGD